MRTATKKGSDAWMYIIIVPLVIALVLGLSYGCAGLLQWALWHCGVKQAAEWPTWAVAIVWAMISGLFANNQRK